MSIETETAEQLRKRLAEIRTAFADYTRSEGCGCCRNYDAHEVNAKRLGLLLEVPPYSDDSGYDFDKFRSSKS